jgi:hypothetical protein
MCVARLNTLSHDLTREITIVFQMSGFVSDLCGEIWNGFLLYTQEDKKAQDIGHVTVIILVLICR